MPILTVTHRTIYHYAEPVILGPHRMMMRPRDSHDLRLVDTSLSLSPAPSLLTRWIHDVLTGNSFMIVQFAEPAE